MRLYSGIWLILSTWLLTGIAVAGDIEQNTPSKLHPDVPVDPFCAQ